MDEFWGSTSLGLARNAATLRFYVVLGFQAQTLHVCALYQLTCLLSLRNNLPLQYGVFHSRTTMSEFIRFDLNLLGFRSQICDLSSEILF